jgi:prepilin signal peptidase PulO-like enzyme (type II secretory pathway)
VTAVQVVLAAVGAGLGVRLVGRGPRSRSCWWVAAATAALAALVASSRSPVPVASSACAAGLTAAAVIDAVEGRIPAVLARGTMAAAWGLLVVDGVVSGEWTVVVVAGLLTGVLVLGFTFLWLANGMGFGDVRLAGATVTAMASGVEGLAVLVAAAFMLAAVVVVARRVRARRGGGAPFGPALAFGWLVATWVG